METQSYEPGAEARTGDFDSDAQRGTLAESLAQPIEVLRLGWIALRWLRRSGIETVGQLVIVHPNGMKKRAGRRFLVLRQAVEQCIGDDWALARATVLGLRPSEARVPLAVQWTHLRAAVSEACHARQLQDMPALPTRMRHYAARERIETVGELLAVPY